MTNPSIGRRAIHTRHRNKRPSPWLACCATAIALLCGATLTATNAFACACGCSVFDVGGIGGLPQEDDHGGRIFFEYYHANQTQNWIGTSKAPASLNVDKRITTNWYTVGGSYMFNREWGVMGKVPYADRTFVTQDPDSGALNKFKSTDWGDAELMGMYTGFFKDMSTGLLFGLKLPTGVDTARGIDRDTQIGSGSTDLILGAFHRGIITGDNAWQYFSQVRWLKPFAYKSAFNPGTGVVETYKPGAQIDGAIGIVYNNGYKLFGFDKIAPLLQLIGSHRERDSGTGADPLNTGYDRLMISPGVEFTLVLDEANKRVLKVYGDVEVPIYQRMNAGGADGGRNGQLVAPVLYKMSAAYTF